MASVKRKTGTTNPSSTATATPIFTWWLMVIASSFHCELIFGCFFNAIAQALITISLNETLVSGTALIIALDFIASSILTSIVKL